MYTELKIKAYTYLDGCHYVLNDHEQDLTDKDEFCVVCAEVLPS